MVQSPIAPSEIHIVIVFGPIQFVGKRSLEVPAAVAGLAAAVIVT